MRVKVYINQKHPLGEGEFLDNVPMTEVRSEEEDEKHLKAYFAAIYGREINDELWKKITEHRPPYSEQTTPKIRLDRELTIKEQKKMRIESRADKHIVYGCEIWWEPIYVPSFST